MALVGGENIFDKLFFHDVAPLVRLHKPDWAAKRTGLSMDMKETDKAFVAVVDIPGVAKEDIHVSCKDDVLTIAAEYKREEKKEDEHHHWQERHSGHVSRSIRLPEHVDIKAIEASQKDGVLTITIPKVAEEDNKSVHKVTIT